MKKNGKTIDKVPPKTTIKSVQMDLFTQFVTNDKTQISNTVDIWERIPKYFPARILDKLQPEKGQPDPYEWGYTENGNDFSVVIQPALIKEKGSYRAYFPSATEELIEETLKKILSDQQYGIHDPQNIETWVRFSLSMLYRELQLRGKSRSRVQIKHAIEVMNKCNVAFYKDGKEIWSGAILQDLVTIGRDQYLADTDSHHIAKMPIFISHAINNLDYRQFNYQRLMSCNSTLSRWIYKRLINRYRQANMINDYHFMYKDLLISGLLQQSRERDNRQKVLEALEELIGSKVLIKFEKKNITSGRKVVDVKYTLFPSQDFVSEQKAANKRSKNNKNQLPENSIISVDNNTKVGDLSRTM